MSLERLIDELCAEPPEPPPMCLPRVIRLKRNKMNRRLARATFRWIDEEIRRREATARTSRMIICPLPEMPELPE